MRLLKTKNCLINVSELNVDPRYQRLKRKAHVKRIASNLDHDAFGSLCVGRRRDGTHWVVDGFQRLSACEMAEISKVPCDVFESEGPAHEARIFRLKNRDRVGVNSNDLFKALIAERDPDTLKIVKICANHGFEIMTERTFSSTPDELACVAAIQKAYKHGNLDKTLEILRLAWDGEQDATRGDILAGVSQFVRLAGEFDQPRLTKKLSKKSPLSLLRFSDNFRQMLGGGSRAKGIAMAIAEMYNKGARKNRIEIR